MTKRIVSTLRRDALARIATVAGAALVPSLVRAQGAYPTKPVRVIVPYSAGGGADTLARTIFGKVSEKLGQQFVIDNRPGGGATIGAAVVAKAAPDGYTILYDATAFSINPTLWIAMEGSTSTGTGDSVTVRSTRRVPTATSSSSGTALGASEKSRVVACPADTVTEWVTAAKPSIPACSS